MKKKSSDDLAFVGKNLSRPSKPNGYSSVKHPPRIRQQLRNIRGASCSGGEQFFKSRKSDLTQHAEEINT